MCSGDNFKSQQSKLKICYWNIHGSKSKIIPNKLCDSEFLEILSNSDVVALSEIHTQDKDISIPGYRLVKQKIREKKNKGPKISGGMAVFVKETLYDLVHVVPNTNENSIWIKFKQKAYNYSEDIYLGTFYLSPYNTQKKSNDDSNKNKTRTDIFELLNGEIKRFKDKGTILIKGDLNARTGRNDDFIRHDKFDEDFGLENNYNLPSRNSEDSSTNIRGGELLDFCKTNDYVIVNGRKVGDIFGKYTSHQWNGSGVVDYLITQNTDYDKIQNFTVGEYIPWLSDHCPIYTEINLNTPEQTDLNDTVKLHDKEPGYIFNENHKDIFLRRLNTEAIKHRFEPFSNNHEVDTIQLADEIKNTIMETAKECNFKKNKSNKKNNLTPWFDKECHNIKNKIGHLGKKLKKNPNDKNLRTELFKQKKILQKLVRRKKRQYKQAILSEMNNSHNRNQKHFWKLAKKLEQKPHNIQYVSHSNLWNHFKSTLNSSRNVNIPPDSLEKGVLDQHFNADELKKACNTLKMGKATGIDNLSNEMISCFTNVYPHITIKLFNNILDNNQIIPDWTVGIITPIFKKGSKTDPNNYRGISLLSCFGKLFMALLHNRLLAFAISNNIISPNQLGFLPGNRTSDAHLIIHNLIQKQCYRNNRHIYTCFIDFSKAFDTIPRDKLLQKLLNHNIKGNFFNTIKHAYSNDRACIKINNKMTDTFDINQGVKQGCILSPLLFNIYMSDLPKIIEANLTNPDAEQLSCLIWADDVVLFSENQEGLNNMLNSMGKYCKDNELIINIDKTKCMILNKTGRLIRTKKFSLNNSNIEIVRSYKYLGFIITPSGEIKTGLNDLRDRAMKAFFKLKNLMGNTFHSHLKTTLHLLDTLIKPILLYASDFWGCLQPPNDNPIEKMYYMAYKHILGVQKQTTNIGVLLELGRIPLQSYAIKAAIKNWERIKTKENNIHLQTSYQGAIRDNLPWVTNIKDLLNKNGMTCHYNNSCNNEHKNIHKTIFHKLSDIFHQEAFNTILNTQSKLRTYGLLKKQIGAEKYLFEITNPTIRQSCTKLRLSNHILNIETGRHKKIPKDLRFCPFCPNSIESEIHFLLDCCAYKTLRQNITQQIIKHQPNFNFRTHIEKLQYMFSERIIQFTSKFVYECFETRKFLLATHKRLS